MPFPNSGEHRQVLAHPLSAADQSHRLSARHQRHGDRRWIRGDKIWYGRCKFAIDELRCISLNYPTRQTALYRHQNESLALVIASEAPGNF
jgi:hypothetical protein